MIKTLKLRKREIPYEEAQVPWKTLAFYPENPRIYSKFADAADRTQENIQTKLEAMDHVKELRSEIDKDGQVNEPLYCMAVSPDSELHGHYDYMVLEGNSRLAAMRMSRKASLPPSMDVPCNILDFSAYDEQQTDDLIFILLSGFHISGKTNWSSYENGSYVHRRFHNHNKTTAEISQETNLGVSDVRNMVAAYQMMVESNDSDPSHWSYYLAYVSSNKLKTAETNYPKLKERVVQLIKDEQFTRALDMRDKLPVILSNKTAQKIFFDKKESDPFAEALAEADVSGSTDVAYKRVQRFRTDIAKKETYAQLVNLLQGIGSRERTVYELEQIQKSVNRLLKRKLKKSK